MRINTNTIFVLLLLAVVAMYNMACNRTQYICPAYQSAFYLSEPVDTKSFMIIGKDSSLYAFDSSATESEQPEQIFISPVQQPKRTKNSLLGVTPEQFALFDIEDTATAPIIDNMVRKNKVLLIERMHKKKKEKLMATVPMITVFPDSAQADTNLFETDKTRIKQ